MNFVVEAQNLSKRFAGVQALDNASLALRQGDIFALVGPNGAGKTTLLHVLLNLQRADRGESSLLGVSSRSLRHANFRQIGFVSETQRIPDWMSTIEFLRYLRPFYPSWDDALARELVDRFELPAKRSIKKLSRGMRMKALLASSLAFRPKVLLLDEPFSGLDPLVRDEILSGVLELVEGAAVLIASHDINEVERVASHVGYLEHGRYLFVEETDALLRRFREITLCLPEGTAALKELPPTWLRVQSQGTLLRFIDTNWNDDTLRNHVQRLYGHGVGCDSRPLSLRDIVVALAKEGRSHRREAA